MIFNRYYLPIQLGVLFSYLLYNIALIIGAIPSLMSTSYLIGLLLITCTLIHVACWQQTTLLKKTISHDEQLEPVRHITRLFHFSFMLLIQLNILYLTGLFSSPVLASITILFLNTLHFLLNQDKELQVFLYQNRGYLTLTLILLSVWNFHWILLPLNTISPCFTYQLVYVAMSVCLYRQSYSNNPLLNKPASTSNLSMVISSLALFTFSSIYPTFFLAYIAPNMSMFCISLYLFYKAFYAILKHNTQDGNWSITKLRAVLFYSVYAVGLFIILSSLFFAPNAWFNHFLTGSISPNIISAKLLIAFVTSWLLQAYDCLSHPGPAIYIGHDQATTRIEKFGSWGIYTLIFSLILVGLWYVPAFSQCTGLNFSAGILIMAAHARIDQNIFSKKFSFLVPQTIVLFEKIRVGFDVNLEIVYHKVKRKTHATRMHTNWTIDHYLPRFSAYNLMLLSAFLPSLSLTQYLFGNLSILQACFISAAFFVWLIEHSTPTMLLKNPFQAFNNQALNQKLNQYLENANRYHKHIISSSLVLSSALYWHMGWPWLTIIVNFFLISLISICLMEGLFQKMYQVVPSTSILLLLKANFHSPDMGPDEKPHDILSKLGIETQALRTAWINEARTTDNHNGLKYTSTIEQAKVSQIIKDITDNHDSCQLFGPISSLMNAYCFMLCWQLVGTPSGLLAKFLIACHFPPDMLTLFGYMATFLFIKKLLKSSNSTQHSGLDNFYSLMFGLFVSLGGVWLAYLLAPSTFIFLTQHSFYLFLYFAYNFYKSQQSDKPSNSETVIFEPLLNLINEFNRLITDLPLPKIMLVAYLLLGYAEQLPASLMIPPSWLGLNAMSLSLLYMASFWLCSQYWIEKKHAIFLNKPTVWQSVVVPLIIFTIGLSILQIYAANILLVAHQTLPFLLPLVIYNLLILSKDQYANALVSTDQSFISIFKYFLFLPTRWLKLFIENPICAISVIAAIVLFTNTGLAFSLWHYPILLHGIQLSSLVLIYANRHLFQNPDLPPIKNSMRHLAILNQILTLMLCVGMGIGYSLDLLYQHYPMMIPDYHLYLLIGICLIVFNNCNQKMFDYEFKCIQNNVFASIYNHSIQPCIHLLNSLSSTQTMWLTLSIISFIHPVLFSMMNVSPHLITISCLTLLHISSRNNADSIHALTTQNIEDIHARSQKPTSSYVDFLRENHIFVDKMQHNFDKMKRYYIDKNQPGEGCLVDVASIYDNLLPIRHFILTPDTFKISALNITDTRVKLEEILTNIRNDMLKKAHDSAKIYFSGTVSDNDILEQIVALKKGSQVILQPSTYASLSNEAWNQLNYICYEKKINLSVNQDRNRLYYHDQNLFSRFKTYACAIFILALLFSSPLIAQVIAEKSLVIIAFLSAAFCYSQLNANHQSTLISPDKTWVRVWHKFKAFVLCPFWAFENSIRKPIIFYPLSMGVACLCVSILFNPTIITIFTSQLHLALFNQLIAKNIFAILAAQTLSSLIFKYFDTQQTNAQLVRSILKNTLFNVVGITLGSLIGSFFLPKSMLYFLAKHAYLYLLPSFCLTYRGFKCKKILSVEPNTTQASQVTDERLQERIKSAIIIQKALLQYEAKKRVREQHTPKIA